ncbi:MAG: glycosyltransferase family 4 protein [Sumerlaeia bacterium]
MSRLLVVATGPLLEEDNPLASGQCLRTLHFVRPLWEQKHQVTLITVPIPGAETTGTKFSITKKQLDGKPYYALGTSEPAAIIPHLSKILQRPFDCVVGINPYPAFLIACCEQLKIPFWADLNGYTMAEGQTRGARLQTDCDFEHFWRMEAKTLLRADRFSTVSERQANCLFGELAMLGRFSFRTHEEQFAHAVPNAVYKIYQEVKRTKNLPKVFFHETFVKNVRPETKLILWSGGFNTWTNVPLLFEALSLVLAKLPNTEVVCTGGAVNVHDEQTYAEFCKLVQNSDLRMRFYLLGWTKLNRVVALHARANVGINVDGNNSETRFGARNRLTNMLGAGLPVVTTKGTEIADWIERRAVGLTTPLGSAGDFAEAIIHTLTHEQEALTRAANGRKLALAEFSAAATLGPFLEWCSNPVHASDFGQAPTTPRARLEEVLNGNYERALFAQASLQRLRQKPLMQTWYKIKSLLKKSNS